MEETAMSGLPEGFPRSISREAVNIARSLLPERAGEIHRLVHKDGLLHGLAGKLVPRVAPEPPRWGTRLEGLSVDAVSDLERAGALPPGVSLVRCEAHHDPEYGWMHALGYLINTEALNEVAEKHRDLVQQRIEPHDGSPADAVLAML